MIHRDVWKGVSRISLAVCRHRRRLPPPWWHCAMKRAHLGLLEFGSQPLALPDDLLPWFGQRRSRHRWKGQFAQHGGHQCALCRSVTEKLRARREKCATFVNDCKAVCILENVTGRNDEDITTHCYASEKADTTTLNHSDDGMER